jgi:hypothetical protein
MRWILAVAATFFVAFSVSGQSTFRFDPPAPDSHTRVSIQTVVNWRFADCLRSQDVVVDGSIIIIKIFTTLSGFPCTQLPQALPVEITASAGPLATGLYLIEIEDFDGILATGTLPIADADPLFIVTPNTARVGDQVSILFGESAVCFTCDPQIEFGGTPARVDGLLSGRILVTVPAHAPGTVPVTIDVGPKRYVEPVGFHYSAAGERPDPAFFESVLFPAAVSGAGAYGALWETRIGLRSGPTILTSPVDTLFHGHCVEPCDARPAADSTVVVTGVHRPRGWIEYVPRQSSASVWFSERVANLSPGKDNGDTSIPVAREQDMLERTFWLVDVPNEAGSRIAMRMYSIDGQATARVVVRSLTNDSHVIGAAFDFTVTAVDGTFDLAEATIGDLVARNPRLSGLGPLMISVTPEANRRLWAFVSVTNNETGHVTIVAP